jgi:hypothetical protein
MVAIFFSFLIFLLSSLFFLSPNFLISQDEELEALITASSKLALLDRMLKKLKETGHRVLIFSQVYYVNKGMIEFEGFRLQFSSSLTFSYFHSHPHSLRHSRTRFI